MIAHQRTPKTKGMIVRFVVLDLVRCVAIILLLMAHIGQTIIHPIGGFFGISHFYRVSLGGLAVTIFLILSGAVLELQYGGKNIHYLHFIAKRFLRIYPVYYLSLFIGIIIYFLRSFHETGQFFSGFSKLVIGDIVFSITGGYALVGSWGGPFINTSWFIELIMILYIIFPFLTREIQKRPNISIIFLMVISVLSRLMLGKDDILPMRSLDWFPLCRIFEFSFGIYLAVMFPRISLHYLESSKRLGSIITFFSEISFPLFLIHHPFLFMINYLTSNGVNQLLAICYYVLISLTVSWMILTIDRRIPRSLILENIESVYTKYK